MSVVGQFAALAPKESQDPKPTSPSNSQGDEVCIPNISLLERRKRLAAGGIQFALALIILAALIAAGADRWWRLVLFLLFWGAASGFFQWRGKT
jgi:fatty acid desaturase